MTENLDQKMPKKTSNRFFRELLRTPYDTSWKPERTIPLGKKFYPFNPSSERPVMRHKRINLIIDEREWPMFIADEPFNLPRSRSLTPFNPGLGYEIDSDDFTLEKRTAKVELAPTPETYEENQKSRLDPSELYSDKFTHLSINGVGSILHEFGLNENIDGMSGMPSVYFKFSNKTLELLRRLRVIVKLPMEAYEGKPKEFNLEHGELKFDHFYIQKKGPLATSETKQEAPEETIIQSDQFVKKSPQDQDREIRKRARKQDIEYTLSMEGLFLAFPNDPEILKQISVQFVIVDNKPGKKTQDRGGEK